MPGRSATLFLSLAILFGMNVVHGRNVHQAAKPGQAQPGEIERAVSAAPASIAAGAAVIRMDDDGRMTSLREGHNGWTCFPRDPATPLGHPVCIDGPGLAWFAKTMAGHDPDPDKVGYSYMLKGGSVWSNVDVTATRLPPGEKTYITIPPHVMVMNAKVANSSGFPSGLHPDTHKPFVMYGGTPYAILIIPLE
jgi:hypothetical protein